jgi:hypothetical protein
MVNGQILGTEGRWRRILLVAMYKIATLGCISTNNRRYHQCSRRS